MQTSRFVRAAALAALALVVAAGCGGAGFEPASNIKGLRVLALQKEPAYARPDETVQMKLLYWDGKVGEGSSRNIAFDFLQCDDPAADLYYGCFDHGLEPLLGASAPSSMGDDAPIVTLSATIPSSIIRPKFPIAYGLKYIFFSACAGQLGLDPSPDGFPLACFDDQMKKLGPDDFVPGYSAIYVYAELRNANPVVDADLVPSLPADMHVARCTESDRGNCPTFDVKPMIDPASAEVDPLATDANGGKLKEQLWIAYLATGGDFTKDLRLVNDATTGWNDDYGTKFRAPATAGPVHLFGIVHDNRGGVAWAQKRIIVD
jgi:hypothetical protein